MVKCVHASVGVCQLTGVVVSWPQNSLEEEEGGDSVTALELLGGERT